MTTPERRRPITMTENLARLEKHLHAVNEATLMEKASAIACALDSLLACLRELSTRVTDLEKKFDEKSAE